MTQTPDLAALLPSWEISLQAERKSPNTIKAYGDSVRAFLAWSARHGRAAALERRTVAAFTSALLADHGAAAATANVRHRSLRRFSAWLAEEGELAADPLLGIRPPKLDKKIVPKLTDDELRLLLKACDGKGLADRRDEAIVRLATEAMCRADELLAMTVDDVDLRRGLATITRGKGGKGRIVPFGPDRAGRRPVHAAAPRPRERRQPGAVARGARQEPGLLGAVHLAAAPRRTGRCPALPPAPAAPHRGFQVAGRGRQRRRADGRGGVVQPGNDLALHRGHGGRARGGGITAAQPRGPVTVATLELECGQCGELFMRWETDPGKPFVKQFDGQQFAARTEAPGAYRLATDGKWYRWAPGPAAGLPDGAIWTRYVFTCPNGCRTSPQAHIGKLEDAAEAVLRALHEAKAPLLRTTVDTLLRCRT